MSTLQLAALILAGEFALLAWVILFLMLRRQHHQTKDDEVHAEAVMEHLESSEHSHRDALTNLFENTYRLEGDELAAKVDEYMERERAFYNVMLNLYLNRDGEKLKEIPAELAKVIKPWAEITPTGMISANEVTSLENERAQLSAELENTKETLEQLMDEYTAAFQQAEQAKAKPADKPPATPAGADTAPPASSAEDAEDVNFDDLDMDDADFDIQAMETAQPEEPEESEAPETALEPEPTANTTADAEDAAKDTVEDVVEDSVGDTAKDAVEDALDPSEIDAMLEQLAKETASDSAAAAPDADRERALSPQEIEDARARDELEGLADLFDMSDDSDSAASDKQKT
ncbi:hypothetical protein [Allochromatium palmeri]|uniref:Uncharacterized protein n=1 Tax=Allochromatium palmeri TaxID=231048 RepID=A0A6N8EGL3_9GAMM|nr:hypothetical protein [Allochromatium palmeri]MTW21627.1 hypothetical protein [Allochromatium palmeri]